MSRKSDRALERRLAQLFGDAERQARLDVLPVMDEAVKQGAFGGSGVAVSVSKIVELRASATIDDALVSLDKSGGRQARAGLVRAAIDDFFHAVADVGKQGPAFPGSRNALIDALNEEARLRMQRRVDTHLGGWNDPNQPWHLRNAFVWEWGKIVMSGVLGFASGIALMMIKARWFAG